eukprot:TRINITY_DN5692_c0_g1_i6.p1 TRINITY_DN5692_c0_g1~~TRINITY_DN5692_c0_g1_i6.p1  ORF type:complete len:128 (-),score=2.86 TRINITY_DN5692_c0_g1_i6:188-571(-)
MHLTSNYAQLIISHDNANGSCSEVNESSYETYGCYYTERQCSLTNRNIDGVLAVTTVIVTMLVGIGGFTFTLIWIRKSRSLPSVIMSPFFGYQYEGSATTKVSELTHASLKNITNFVTHKFPSADGF